MSEATIERGPRKGQTLAGRRARLYTGDCLRDGSCTEEQVLRYRALYDGEPTPLPATLPGPDFDLAEWVGPTGGCCGKGAVPPRASTGPFRWVSTRQLTEDAVRLAALLPPNVSGVVGVPRSGLIPASVIAAHLHLPLHELSGGQPRRLGHGSRGRGYGFAGENSGGPLVVVDDTVYAGSAMRQARARLGTRAVYAAVYVRPGFEGAVDFFARPLPSPHLLEWNWANNGPLTGHSSDPVYGAGVATDLDGVLLHDAHSGGPPGTPYLVARSAVCPLIATGRRERHRAATEAELRRWGMRWQRLAMFPDSAPDNDAERATHKARHYAASRCGFFIESCPSQAVWIADATGKPVICPRTGEVLHRQPVTVPPCPPLALSPRRPWAVVTVAVGEKGQDMLSVTGPFLAAHARRANADLVVLDWPGHPDWPMSAKYALPEVLRHYERVLYVDADVLLRPGCLDPLALVPRGHFGARVERGVHPVGGGWLAEDYGRTLRSVGKPSAVPDRYFNAGVMVLERGHASLLAPPTAMVRPTHCAEQHLTNHAVHASGVPFFALPVAANHMVWSDGPPERAPRGAVLHFTGCGTHAERMRVMREAALPCLVDLAQPGHALPQVRLVGEHANGR